MQNRDNIYIIRDREAGNMVDYFDTLEEAQTALAEYEEQDKKDGIYEEDFYEIAEVNEEELDGGYDYDPYELNMPCDNYGMVACSPSCPKFYECN